VHELAPRATIQRFMSVEEVFGSRKLDVAAFVLGAERGSAWTLLHPEYSVVVPEGRLIRIPLAYPLARRDQEFAAFVNAWIELKRKDGAIDALFKYWILGENAEPPRPRWSIARNVLHWID
jgi:proton glutamate symport protein